MSQVRARITPCVLVGNKDDRSTNVRLDVDGSGQYPAPPNAVEDDGRFHQLFAQWRVGGGMDWTPLPLWRADGQLRLQLSPSLLQAAFLGVVVDLRVGGARWPSDALHVLTTQSCGS